MFLFLQQLHIEKSKKIQNFQLNEEISIFQTSVLKFGDLLGGWKLATNAKLQLNISQIMVAEPKNTGA